jgi:hypothetical protein
MSVVVDWRGSVPHAGPAWCSSISSHRSTTTPPETRQRSQIPFGVTGMAERRVKVPVTNAD